MSLVERVFCRASTMVSRSATQEGVSPCKNSRTCSSCVLKWTYLGLVSGMGDECERMDEGRQRAKGLVLTSIANTGLFIADLMGSPFLCRGTFFLVEGSKDVLLLFCVPAAATVTDALAKVVYDVFDKGIDNVVQCG